MGLQGQKPVHLGLRKDSFGEDIFYFGPLHRGRRVELEIPYPVGEAEQRLYRINGPGPEDSALPDA